ncbi:MAG: GNAT family N-acetyltransferase [Eubacteriales bacterium]|nr:GNAT family N-acetyltransferase [Eubacteriales bacterium]
MKLWLDANIEAHDFISADYWKDNYNQVENMLPEAEIYVYENEGRIEGFTGLTGDYIAGIFVRKECRSKGVGKSLLDHVKKNRSRLVLQVYKKNLRAEKFYEREGFCTVKEQMEEGTGQQEIIMEWIQ